MIYSNERKLALSGWFFDETCSDSNSNLELQKFLFFYEAFSKVSGEEADFHGLKGYANGPVFSQVWGDHSKEGLQFSENAKETYLAKKESINIERAKVCKFIVKAFTDRELSEFTHEMDVWKCKKNRIENREYQVPLSEDDFSKSDEDFMIFLQTAFPKELVESSKTIPINSKHFVFSKEDHANITPEHYDTLYEISQIDELENPVYVSIDENGVLIVD